MQTQAEILEVKLTITLLNKVGSGKVEVEGWEEEDWELYL